MQSDTDLEYDTAVDDVKTNVTGEGEITGRFLEVMEEIAAGNKEAMREKAQKEIDTSVEKSKQNMGAVMGRSRGILSSIVNSVTSGNAFVSMAVALSSIVHSDNIAVVILIILGLALYVSVYIFGIWTYRVIMRRLFLEGMNYDDVHINRALFLVKVKQWFRASMTMCLMGFYDMLWTFTIVGGIIKRYSYFMVPYIVAENPGIKPNDTITLSRKMMNGHKWECFKFEMSFLGWTILGMLTFSLSEIFYSNPYKIAAFTEYYAELRRLAKENQIPNADLLNDTYLFEVPEEAVLKQAYEDVLKMREETFEIQGEISKVRRFFAVVFGVGGMAIVYFLAPFLDGIFRRIPYKKLAITGAVLLFVFMADSIYSSKHPNVGKGITDYESESVRNEKQVVLGYMPQEYIG